MKHRFISIIAVSLIISLSGCATSKGDLFINTVGAPENTVEDTGDNTIDENTDTYPEGLTVTSTPDKARVYINHRYAGITPFSTELETGRYKITLKKEGYYAASRWIDYTAGEALDIYFTLEQITGYLYIKTDPEEADIRIEGWGELEKGVNKLAVGRYRVEASMFGYEPYSTIVSIFENRTTDLAVSLKPAAFRFSRINLSRKKFNPGNPSGLGTSEISFTVSTFGKGTLSIFSPEGEKVVRHSFDRFTTWSQSFLWDGRDSRGKLLPDGTYRIVIEGSREDGSEPDTSTAYIGIDRSIVIRSRTSFSGVSGTLMSPTPDILPQGSYQISIGSIGHVESGGYRFPSAVSLRFSLRKGVEGNLSEGMIIQSPADTAYYISAAVKKTVTGTYRDPFSLSAFLKGTYLFNTRTDPVYNFTGLSAGAAVSLSMGPVSVIFSPDMVISPYRVTSSGEEYPAGFYIFSYGRGAVILDLGSVWLGLSGTVRTVPFDSGFETESPFSVGSEIHWIVPETEIVISGFATAEIDWKSGYFINAGGSVGIIH